MKQSRLRRVAALAAAAIVGTFVVTLSGPGAAVADSSAAGKAGTNGVTDHLGRPAPLDGGRVTADSARVSATDDEEEPVIRRAMPNPLLKESLAGEEEEREDGPEDPSLSALCQDFLGKPTPFGDPSPNVDVINNDSTVPNGSQTGCSTAQNETSIAVNPANPRNIVAGANDYRTFSPRLGGHDSSSWVYTSFDGGRTWKNIQLPGLTVQSGGTGVMSDMDSAGDPAISFGPRNTVYYVSLVFSRLNSASGIAVNVSHDGGLHWDAPAIIRTDGVNPDGTPVDTPLFNDKPWIGADPRSGTVYVTWTRFEFDEDGDYIQSPIVMSTSRDFGRTWSDEHVIGTTRDTFTTGITPFAQGSNPRVTNDGTLYVAYETSVCESVACDQFTDHDATVIARSRDGGRTFSITEIAPNFDFPEDPDTGGGLTGENFRVNSYPQLAYDTVTNKLWVTWADDRNGQYDEDGNSIRTNGDVTVASSANGTQWKVETIRTPADEVYPAVAVLSNRVAVSFFTRLFDQQGIGLDYAYVSAHGSMANARVQRITTVSQNPQLQFIAQDPDTGEVFQGVFIGDYTAIAIGSDFRVHPLWVDFRGNPGTTLPNQDAYTQSISLLN